MAPDQVGAVEPDTVNMAVDVTRVVNKVSTNQAIRPGTLIDKVTTLPVTLCLAVVGILLPVRSMVRVAVPPILPPRTAFPLQGVIPVVSSSRPVE